MNAQLQRRSAFRIIIADQHRRYCCSPPSRSTVGSSTTGISASALVGWNAFGLPARRNLGAGANAAQHGLRERRTGHCIVKSADPWPRARGPACRTEAGYADHMSLFPQAILNGSRYF